MERIPSPALDEKYGPEKTAKFTFFADKAIFRYPAFECCRDHNFSSRITKFRVHNLNTFTYLCTAKKVLL